MKVQMRRIDRAERLADAYHAARSNRRICTFIRLRSSYFRLRGANGYRFGIDKHTPHGLRCFLCEHRKELKELELSQKVLKELELPDNDTHSEDEYGENWTWEHNFDPSFVEPSLPISANQSNSWEDVFSNNLTAANGNNCIKEIVVNDLRHTQKPEENTESSPPKVAEPRQKFQRFREKKFICDECDRSFTMKQNVQQHFFQYHNPNGANKKPMRTNQTRFQCTKCNKIFKTLDKAQKHEARLHGDMAAPTVFVCQHCNKIYNAQSQLKEHIDVVHQNLRPHKCKECGMQFGRAGGLRRHDMMVHQQKKHECPYEGCNHPGYKCTKALAAHIRSVHTLDRPFACLFCERTFVRKNDLKVHEMTHSAQCEYTCTKCSSSFRRLIYLQKHEKRCTGVPTKKSNSRPSENSSAVPCNTRKRRATPAEGEGGTKRRCTRKRNSTTSTNNGDQEDMLKKSDEISSVDSEQLFSVMKEEPALEEAPASAKPVTASEEKMVVVKEEPIDEGYPEPTVEKSKIEKVVKNEPREDGEISDSQPESVENPTCFEPTTRRCTRSASGARPLRKSTVVNLAHNTPAEKPPAKKQPAKALPNPPVKPVTRNSARRSACDANAEGSRRQNGRCSIREVNNSNETSGVVINVINKELEEGEIDDQPQMSESNEGRRLRRNTSFEPRAEAVMLKQRPRKSIAHALSRLRKD